MADWTPLDEGDPLPGDPLDVAALGRRYLDTVKEINDASARLTRLSNATDGSLVGLAGTAYRSHAGDLASRIKDADGRYTAAGNALLNFSDAMSTAQADARRAVIAARQAKADQQANQPDPPRDSSAPPLSDAEQQAADSAAAQKAARLTTANDAWNAAVKNFGTAVGYYNTAAKSAASAINHGSDDKLKDGFWDKAFTWLKKWMAVVAIIVLVIIVVCIVLACPALLLALGVSAELAATLGGIASTVLGIVEMYGVIASGVSLIADLTLKHDGLEDGWSSVIWDVAGVATFGLSKYVIGAKIATSVEASQSAVKSGAAADAALQSITTDVITGNTATNTLINALRASRAAQEDVVQAVEAAKTTVIPSMGTSLALRSVENCESLSKMVVLSMRDPSLIPVLNHVAALARVDGAVSNVDLVHEIKENWAHWITEPGDEARQQAEISQLLASVQQHSVPVP